MDGSIMLVTILLGWLGTSKAITSFLQALLMPTRFFSTSSVLRTSRAELASLSSSPYSLGVTASQDGPWPHGTAVLLAKPMKATPLLGSALETLSLDKSKAAEVTGT